MQTNLAKTETAIDSQNSKLGDQKKSLDTATTAGGEYNDQLAKIGRGVDFANTISSINSLADKIQNLASKAISASKAIWNMGADAGEWADTLTKAATTMGVDV